MTAPLPHAQPPAPLIRFCSDEKPRCPAGHRLSGRLTTDGIIVCRHQDRRDAPACGILCWAAVISFGGSAQVRGTGERLWIVVNLSPSQVAHFTRTPMTLLERLAYLGYTPPEVLRDLLDRVEP